MSWQIVENYCMENLFFENLCCQRGLQDSFCRVYHNAVCIHIFVVRVRNVQCAVQYHYVSSCVTLHHHSSPFCIIHDVWPCWILLVFFGMINFFLGESLEEDAPLMESGLDSLSAVDFRNQALGP